MENRQLLGVAQAAYYNVILQIFFRLQTFLLNAIVLRYISQDVLGIVNVRLLLYYSSVQFLSKECFRNACLGFTTAHNWRHVINLLWLMVPTAAICASLLGYLWLCLLEQPSSEYLQQYSRSVWVLGVCCVLEAAAEPMYIIARLFLFNKLRVIMESLCVTLRCLCFTLLVCANPRQAIDGFVTGQVMYTSLWVLGVYAYYAYYVKMLSRTESNSKGSPPADFPFRHLTEFFPCRLKGQASLPREQLALTWSFFKQGVLKQLLTEGERYVMTVFSVLSFADQGVFDVVSNLGAMAARFIFRPVEDSSFQYFSATLRRGVALPAQKQGDLVLVVRVFECLMRFMVILGLVVVVFGYSYSYIVLHVYGGQMLSSGIGPTLLRWQSGYVLLLAVNGITECYVFATMSKADVERYNVVLVAFSVGFVLSSWYFTKLIGSPGFILSNCANMAARIAYSCSYIRKAYTDTKFNPLRGLLPNTAVFTGLFLSFCVTAMSEMYFGCRHGLVYSVIHIFIGLSCLLGLLCIILFKEKDLVRLGYEILVKRKIE